MNHALLMSRFKGFGDLLGNGQGFINGDWSLLDPISQGRPFDQLQYQRPSTAAFFDTVDLRDVRMIETGEDLRLALEPSKSIRIFGKRLGQDLQRHLAVELGIGGLPHLTHPTFTNLGGDCAMAESCADAERH